MFSALFPILFLPLPPPSNVTVNSRTGWGQPVLIMLLGREHGDCYRWRCYVVISQCLVTSIQTHECILILLRCTRSLTGCHRNYELLKHFLHVNKAVAFQQQNERTFMFILKSLTKFRVCLCFKYCLLQKTKTVRVPHHPPCNKETRVHMNGVALHSQSLDGLTCHTGAHCALSTLMSALPLLPGLLSILFHPFQEFP